MPLSVQTASRLMMRVNLQDPYCLALQAASPALKAANKKVEYTIDNRMEYRDIAKDLVNQTAPANTAEIELERLPAQDWYVSAISKVAALLRKRLALVH